MSTTEVQVNLKLAGSPKQLETITVTSKKPMFEQKSDRMVINVKNSVISGTSTALDVLEKSPGIIVDRQNSSIGINGKNGVGLMINGKLMYLTPEALVQYLGGISANNIDKIELVTIPPSKYDAEGNAGLINIVLVNNPYTGFNGGYFIAAGYGKRPLGSAGFNFNYRQGKFNVFGNYSFNGDHFIQPSTGFTSFMSAGEKVTVSSYSDRNAIRQVNNARIGLDYQVDSSSVIGLLLSGYDSYWRMWSVNGSEIGRNSIIDTVIRTINDREMNLWQNIMGNVNFQHKFGGAKLLFVDLNYIYYKDNNPNSYTTDIFNGKEEFIKHENSRSGKITPIKFGILSADYSVPLGKTAKMETGAKIVLSRFSNGITADDLKQGQWVRDSTVSVNYKLRENIAAAYSSVSVQLSNKLSLAAGLRFEYTNSLLESTKKKRLITRKYGELFPTFLLSNKLNENNTVSVSYNRRITRPTFNDLAPFTVFFDPKTYFSGNPALQPAIANSVQASYQYKNISISVSATHEKNSIDNFYFQTDHIDTFSKIVYLSSRNLKYQKYLSANIAMPAIINNWWTMQNNIGANWREISTDFSGLPVIVRKVDFNLSSTQRVILPRRWSMEVTGVYFSTTLVGTAKREPVYRVDAGFQKKFGRKDNTIRFSANDMFNSGGYYNFGDVLPVSGAVVNRTFNFGNLSYKITYSRQFGNSSVRLARERLTGAEDELKRVNN